MLVREILEVLIQLSHRAAHLAQLIRSEPELLKLLTEEKVGDEKNAGFEKDFKTLADILIQEMVRYEISVKVISY